MAINIYHVSLNNLNCVVYARDPKSAKKLCSKEYLSDNWIDKWETKKLWESKTEYYASIILSDFIDNNTSTS